MYCYLSLKMWSHADVELCNTDVRIVGESAVIEKVMLTSLCPHTFSHCGNGSVVFRVNMLMSACHNNENPVGRPQ